MTMYDKSPERRKINAIVTDYFEQSRQSTNIDTDTSRQCGQLLLEYCNRTGEQSAFILIVINGYEEAHYLGGIDSALMFWRQLSLNLSDVLTKNTRLSLLPFGFSIHVWGDDVEQRTQTLLEKTTAVLRHPLPISHVEDNDITHIHVSYLIGYIVYPDDCGMQDTFADVTRYISSAAWAQGNSLNQIHRYTKTSLEELTRRAKIRQRLTQAIDKHHLKFVYQPQYDVLSKEIIGVESLMRWSDPELGQVSPQEFIPVAESCELILPLTALSIDTVAAFVAQYNEQTNNPTRFSINISKSVFNWKQFDLYTIFHNCIKKYNNIEGCLDIEITESSYFDPELSSTVTKTLSKLAKLGIRTIIDDFGSGYGSLSLITSGIVGGIKLDRELTSKLVTDSAETEFLEMLCNVTRNISIKLIAEGVETQSQKALLISKGVSTIQGYLFARPMDGSDLINFVYQQHSQE